MPALDHARLMLALARKDFQAHEAYEAYEEHLD
jgi:hypothetical protein